MCGVSGSINPFTATGRIYTSQKRPSGWPRTYIHVRPTSILFLRICQRPATDVVVVVACLRGLFFITSLIAAYSLGSCSLRKQLFYASRGFCPNGGKQRCGCSQMRHKLVRAVRLMAFVTTAIEERAGFVLLKVRAMGIGWERKLVTGAPGGKKWPYCSQNCWERRPRCSNSQWTPVFVEGSSVRMYKHRREWNIASQLSGELESRSAASKRW